MKVKGKIMLEGAKVRLRPLTLDDVTERYCAWLNDPEVNRCLETRFAVQTLETVRAYVEMTLKEPDVLFLAIVEKSRGEHIGNIKLGPIVRPHRRAEISFFIGDKGFWKMGCASEAVRLLSDYALGDLELHKVTAGCYDINRGSRRIFENLGFVLEGVLRGEYLCENRRVDRLCFAKFKDVAGA